MTRVEEKTVAGKPCRVVRVGDKISWVKYVYEVGSAHGATGMARFGLLDHWGCQYADVVGSPVQGFGVHILYSKCVSVIFHEITNYIPTGKIFMWDFTVAVIWFWQKFNRKLLQKVFLAKHKKPEMTGLVPDRLPAISGER